MRAVVLAAGVGSRLGELVRSVPKCMLTVAGAPILEQNLRWLRTAGIGDVAVNLHHLPKVVTDHFGDGSALGATIRWVYEPELLGTAGTVAWLRDWLGDDRFVVLYGDNLFDVDLARFVSAHQASGARASVALFERADVGASGVAELAPTGRVARFIEKPQPGATESRLVSAGLLLFEPSVLDLVPARGDLSRDVLPRLAEAGLLHGHQLSAQERLLWVDTPADLERTLASVGGRA